jgi:hypothetical protein
MTMDAMHALPALLVRSHASHLCQSTQGSIRISRFRSALPPRRFGLRGRWGAITTEIRLCT